jgi:uncharacterized protein YbjT (DUF2867 family)
MPSFTLCLRRSRYVISRASKAALVQVSRRRQLHDMLESQPVLMIGGTRGTGLLIGRLLHGQGRTIRVLARDPARAVALFGQTVKVVPGDITKSDTLPTALQGAGHIVFTAGCRSGRPVREARIKATEYLGVINVLAAARRSGFAGRFLYMTSSGLTTPSFAAACLNLWKGNTLIWRRRAEDEIRASGLSYIIIRTGILLNRTGGQHEIAVTQRDLPLSLHYRIARADVAHLFLAALEHPRAERTTFEAFWGRRGQPKEWDRLLDGLVPDAE